MANPLEIDFEHPPLERLLSHWLDVRGERVMPQRSEIDPISFKETLPNCWIYRLGEDGEFYCTLSGQDIRDAWNEPMSGRKAAEILGPDFDRYIRDRWETVLKGPAIVYSRQRTGKLPKRSERLVLPVSDADGVPRQVLGASHYHRNMGDHKAIPMVSSDDVRLWDARTLARLPREFSAN